MSVTCTRKIRFDGAHRILGHEGKCANLHGHGYEIEITAAGKTASVDSLGRVIDFSILKDKIGTWVNDNWDHTIILWTEDKDAVEMARKLQVNKEVFVTPFNPTAENMAQYLLHEICPKLLSDTDVKVVRVQINETPNCYATATLM